MEPDSGTDKRKAPSQTAQLVWSIIVAAVIVLIVVIAVTAKIGPGLDATELREQQEQIEERQEQREDRQEEREDQDNNSGSG